MNWYFVKTRGRVEKFGVDKTVERYVQTACHWSEDKMLAALRQVSTAEGVTDLRIVEFREQSHAPSYGATTFDLDKALGI